MVCQAWLDRGDVEAVLATQSAFPLVRGIRHKPRAAASPAAVTDDLPGSMTDPVWRRGFALLERYGLSFDLQTPWWHFGQARDLADTFPETQIVVNHTGLAGRSQRGGPCRLADGAEDAGGRTQRRHQDFGTGPARACRGRRMTTAASFSTRSRHSARDRCMFASNFPVDSLVASFDTIFDGFLAITAGFAEEERRRLFHDNAVRFYRLTV